MTDIGSIVPDAAKVPVAPDLVHPQQTQNGSVSEHLPADSSGQSGTADEKPNAQLSSGQAKQPSKPKAGVVNTILTAPIKGPRSGIHWGDSLGSRCAVQPVAILCTPSRMTIRHMGMSQPAAGTTFLQAVICMIVTLCDMHLQTECGWQQRRARAILLILWVLSQSIARLSEHLDRYCLVYTKLQPAIIEQVSMMSCSACLVVKGN